MDIKTIKQKAIPVFQKYGVSRASLFGSYVRGEQNDKSDIDFLIQLPEKSTLFDLIGVRLDLEDVFKKKIDVVEYESVKPALKKYILSDQKQLYNKL